jgi:protein involved in polysaccharide export with SLBB domain
MYLVSMTISLACALRSLSKSARALPLLVVAALVALVPLDLSAQSPTAAPESSAARNLLPPSPPPVSTGPIVSTNSVTAPSGYILSANDQVAVEVFGEDDLRTNGRLNAEGNLSLPLLGSVHLAGMTLTQATARLTELYARDYLVNPKVNVSLLGYAKRRFTMLGQVNRPGSFEMPEGSPSGIDLLEAVAMAGGYTRIAAPERITVRRHGPKGDEVLKVDGKRLARGGSNNFMVLPGDTVTVGESIF